MTQPTLHPATTASERYDLVVMWILVALFLIAVPFMFVHPGVTLLLFWIGFVLLGFGTFIYRVMFRGTGKATSSTTARCACPACGADIGVGLPEGTEQRCGACGAAFRMTAGAPAPVPTGS